MANLKPVKTRPRVRIIGLLHTIAERFLILVAGLYPATNLSDGGIGPLANHSRPIGQ